MDSIIDLVETGRDQTFGYDHLNRLASASDTGGWSHSYVYDRYGNLYNPGEDAPLTLSFDTLTNRISSAGYRYDAAGNLIEVPGASYQYDAENRLVSVDGGAAASYQYDYLGRRAVKTVSQSPSETRLDYFGARYCDSVLGRFTGVDPSRRSADPLNPQSWNRYAYTFNNPLKFVDPDGREPIKLNNPTAGLTSNEGAGPAEMLRGAVLAFVEAVSKTQGDRRVLGTIAVAALPESDAELLLGMVPVGKLGARATRPLLNLGGDTASSLIASLRKVGLKKLDALGKTGSKETIRKVTGTAEDARRLVEAIQELGGGVVATKGIERGTVYQLKNGGFVTVRQSSPTSPNVVANIDVKLEGVTIQKIKVVPRESP